MAQQRLSFKIAFFAILTAIPTGLGYVLGPLTHSVNYLFSVISLPGLGPGLPGTLHLGFTPLVTVTILARAYLGRGSAIMEGVLLAITGLFFHPGEPAIIRGPKDVLLGVGVELTLLKKGEVDVGIADAIVASFVGGLMSYLPYLTLAIPLSLYLLGVFYVSLLILMSGYLVSCLIGGYIAGHVLKVLPPSRLKPMYTVGAGSPGPSASLGP